MKVVLDTNILVAAAHSGMGASFAKEANMASYALRIPESLFEFARQVAKEEKASMNQFFVTAIAEKVSALKTEQYFRERAARGELANFDAWLSSRPHVPPLPGDEI